MNSPDLSGARFGRLVARHRVPSPDDCTAWLCDCDCGGTKVAARRTLRRGHVRSCGCLARERGAKLAGPSLLDRVFGRLTVLRKIEGPASPRKSMWACRCECGQERSVLGVNLLSGGTRSCGCWRDERSRQMMAERHAAGLGPWMPRRRPAVPTFAARATPPPRTRDGLMPRVLD